MRVCATCGRAMATVLKREGGVVRTIYECPYCKDQDTDRPARWPTPRADEGSSDVPQ